MAVTPTSNSPSFSDAISKPRQPPEFDWPDGQIRFPVAEEQRGTNEWSLVVCGDWAPRFGQQHAMIDNPLGFYHDLLPVLQETDLAIVNVECVITDDDLPAILKAGPSLRVPTSTIAGLTAVPFHLACLANNHIFDYGVEGLRKTRGLLEQYLIQSVGAGLEREEAEQAKVLQIGNTRLAVVNVAEGEEARSVDGGAGVAALDMSRVQGRLMALRTQVDVLIVIVHAGREFLPVPAPHIRSIYRSLIDAGADLVVGHHPHVAQGLEIYKGAPIVYSLGNFAFLNGTRVEAHHRGYLLKVRFRGSEFSALEIYPYHIGAEGLSLLVGSQKAEFLSGLEALSAIIVDDRRLVDVWEAYADRWLATQGAEDLLYSAALLGNYRLLIRSMLRASLRQFKAYPFIRWVVQSLRTRYWSKSTRDKSPTSRNRLSQPDQIKLLDRAHATQLLTTRPSPQMKHGATVLRIWFDTVTHRELYLTALGRVMDEKRGHAPNWAYQLLVDREVFW